MNLRHLRVVIALIFLTLAGAVIMPPGISRAATAGSRSPSASPGAAQGRIGIKQLEVPASQANNPRDEEYIVDSLAPGTVMQRKFEVINQGSVPVHLIVYPAAATISKGTFQFAPGRTQNEMTTWISVSRGALNLAPHSSADLVATVTVPPNAPSGEQYGVIWAQESSSGAGNVTLVSRVGIRLYLSIGAGGAAAPNFTLGTPVASRTAAGAPVVRVAVHNTGGTAVDVRGTLRLTSGPGGVSAGPFIAQTVDTLAPGQSNPDTFVLSSKLPTGPWQASFTMVSGLITKTETVTLSFNGTPASAAHKSFPLVLLLVAIAAVIVLAVVLLLILRSRRSGGSGGSDGSRGSRRTPQATDA
jgi:hypothetical protein